MSGFDCRRQAAADLDEVARQVLSRFSLTRPSLGLVSQGNAGGFSGARLWRSRGMTGDLCLRAWPSEPIAASGLQVIHDLMRSARDAGLAFVPLLLQTYTGATWVAERGRLWDVATWLPGRADFHDHPSHTRLEAACTALARLHRTWALTGGSEGACPAVGRRLARFAQWKALLASGWRPGFSGSRHDRLASQAERAWKLLDRHIDRVPAELSKWIDRRLPLQPCLCDIWHNHVLFEGDAVTGVVDYGAVKLDHVAIDLARLLGSLVEDNALARMIGLNAYGRTRPLDAEESQLVDVLDRTGTLLGLANWLTWIYKEQRVFDERSAVAGRLARLVERVERWPLPS